MDPTIRARFRNHFSIAQKTVAKGISSGRARSAIKHYDQWLHFTTELGLDPFLEAFQDKVPFLQVFGQRIRDGELAIDGNPIRSRSVEDYIRSVAQTFLAMGSDDPRLNSAGKTDFRLARMLAAWKKQDPPANRVKPVPIEVIRRVAFIAQHLPEDAQTLRATADMIIIAFFYLLRPGEYTDSPSDTTPFSLNDVQLMLGSRRLDIFTCPINLLREARGGSLTFTTQKNGVPNEVIRLNRSGDSFLCPVLAIVRRVIHLRENNAPLYTPLGRVFTTNGVQHVTPTLITQTLRDAVKFLGPELGFLPSEVSARSLRAAGAMALLVSGIDTDIIQLLGRWRSDEMFRYLHLTAEPITRNLAARMLTANYTMAPTQLVPCH